MLSGIKIPKKYYVYITKKNIWVHYQSKFNSIFYKVNNIEFLTLIMKTVIKYFLVNFVEIKIVKII